MSWRRIVLISAALSGPSLYVGAAVAQEGSGATTLRSLRACRQLPEPAARLACFDKASEALDTAIAKNEVQVVDRQDIRKARRSLFGFTIPRIALFGGSDDSREAREEFTEINTSVASAREIANGRIEIRLTGEDAVWQTTEPLPAVPRAGAKIRIRKGAIGNYFITVGGRSVRGLRLR